MTPHASPRPPLPLRVNPHVLDDDECPLDYDALVGARALGQAQLATSPWLESLCESTRPENLSPLDYVALAVPLPLDLEGSGIFAPSRLGTVGGDSYYLLRRAADAHISANCMFRIAFPWASRAELTRELAHVRHCWTPDELAGSLWLSPKAALDLAAHYHVTIWIRALLDTSPVTAHLDSHVANTTPLSFNMAPRASADPNRSPCKRAASREVRSTSPTKVDQSIADRPKLEPKKRSRKTKKNTENAEVNGSHKALQKVLEAEAATEALAEIEAEEEAAAEAEVRADVEALAQDQAVKATAQVAEATEEVLATGTAAHGDEPLPENTARVTVTQETTGEGEDEVKHTNVKIDLPLDSSESALPVATEEVVAMAEKIVEDAKDLQKPTDDGKKRRTRKRKASEVDHQEPNGAVPEAAAEADEATQANGAATEPSAKRVRVATPAEEFRREKMQRRAIMGLSVTLAAGAMIPFLSNLF